MDPSFNIWSSVYKSNENDDDDNDDNRIQSKNNVNNKYLLNALPIED